MTNISHVGFENFKDIDFGEKCGGLLGERYYVRSVTDKHFDVHVPHKRISVTWCSCTLHVFYTFMCTCCMSSSEQFHSMVSGIISIVKESD